jgi:UDP-N-acetylmuramate: L-alanyl-gamma-D-glutamyl-meso-diaminopimelate ligase
MKIHLTGVGGVAMGNLAAMLKQAGHTVSGSDHALYPPMSDQLKKWGIRVLPYDEKNIKGKDLIIIGNAISRGHPEAEETLNRNLPYMSLPQALGEFFLKGKEVIVVAGTHGKTTTTFLVDHILTQMGQAPGLFVGGVRSDGMDGFRLSKSPYFVIEGDEYDSAFFDKHSKFLHYRPRYLILNAVEFDHADIFPTFEDYKNTFRKLLRLIPSRGLVVAAAEDAGVREILEDWSLAPVRWFGREGGFEAPGKILCSLKERTAFIGPSRIENFSMLGLHNVMNATAAALVAGHLGLSDKKIIQALQTFPGVLRRQQIRMSIPSGKDAEIVFVEDFAHHPTAVKETMDAVKNAWPDRKVHVLFEPRSATSHRNIFQKEYKQVLRPADSIYITNVFNPGKVKAEERLDVPSIVRALGKKAHFADVPSELLAIFQDHFKPSRQGDVILAMSNGAFGGIYPALEKYLKTFQKS